MFQRASNSQDSARDAWRSSYERYRNGPASTIPKMSQLANGVAGLDGALAFAIATVADDPLSNRLWRL